jgi:ATP dependent DNA ligase-like protein
MASLGPLVCYRLVAAKAYIECGQHEQGQQGGTHEAADDDGGDRLLHLGAGAGDNRHRDESERGHERGHRNRTQACQRTFDDRLALALALGDQLLDEAQHHQAVEHCNAGERDEAAPAIAADRSFPKAQWLTPRLRADVEYRRKTSSGLLRHPSYKGLREDLG